MSQLIALFVVLLAAPWLAPHDPREIHLDARLEPPSSRYWLGTDALGRCQLSRTLHAAPRSLGLAIVIAAAVNATAIALAAIGVFGGNLADRAVSALVNVFISFPPLILALAVIGVVGPSMLAIALAIIWAWWPAETRVARSLLRTARRRDYVDASILCGVPLLKVLWRHILPQVAPALAVRFSLEVAGVVLALSTLGFLGLGVNPPDPEWGMMLNEARPYVTRAPHLLLGPGLALCLSALACNIYAENLRSSLDERLARAW